MLATLAHRIELADEGTRTGGRRDMVGITARVNLHATTLLQRRMAANLRREAKKKDDSSNQDRDQTAEGDAQGAERTNAPLTGCGPDEGHSDEVSREGDGAATLTPKPSNSDAADEFEDMEE